MNGTIITIDTNENMHHPEHKTKFQEMGALCSVKSLDYDFHIIAPDGASIGIERKAPHDYLESIKDRRLFKQGKNLVESVQWPYVVIDGIFCPFGGFVSIVNDKNLTKWSWSSLQGSLISLQEMGITIVFDPDFHGAVKRIVNRSRDDIKIAPRRESVVYSEQESTLMTLPGIGGKKATEYLAQFETLGNAIMQLQTPELADNIKGWGKKSAQKLYDYFGW
jgi:ERCC4-type nuclease